MFQRMSSWVFLGELQQYLSLSSFWKKMYSKLFLWKATVWLRTWVHRQVLFSWTRYIFTKLATICMYPYICTRNFKRNDWSKYDFYVTYVTQIPYRHSIWFSSVAVRHHASCDGNWISLTYFGKLHEIFLTVCIYDAFWW